MPITGKSYEVLKGLRDLRLQEIEALEADVRTLGEAIAEYEKTNEASEETD